MGWVHYTGGLNRRYWHQNNTGGGLTTGEITSGSLNFADIGTFSRSVSYLHNNKIFFKKSKSYLFETTVSNFEGGNPGGNNGVNRNRLYLRIGYFDSQQLDYWQGTSKIIEYLEFSSGGYPTLSLFPADVSASVPFSTDANVGTDNVLQFFSKPTSDFSSEVVSPAGYSGTSQVLYAGEALATYWATKFFAHKATTSIGTVPVSIQDMSVIKNIKLSELDFEVQGWAIYKQKNYLDPTPSGVIGWAYYGGTYSWRVASTQSGSVRHAMGPIRDSQKAYNLYGDPNIDIVAASKRFTNNNFIGLKLLDGQTFNLEFDLVFSTQSGILQMKLYLDNTLPTTYASNPQRGLLIGTFTQSNRYSFYNLNGGQYLYFVGGTISTTTSGPQIFVNADISNISIKQGYSLTDNNEQFAFQPTTLPYSEPTPLSIIGANPESSYVSTSITDETIHETDNGFIGAKKLTYTYTPSNQSIVTRSSFNTGIFGLGIEYSPRPVQFTEPTTSFSTVGFFSNLYGTVSNLAQLNSKLGNGTFRAGVWENGVWNSGWRVDQNMHEFNDISLSFNLKTENVRWRIQLSGPTQSVSNFEIGDRISIGNIVAIDINEKRKLLKNYFTIVNKNETTLIVEVDNVFPIRRIEKDSQNHKILVTKNVWLNGGFLNGYFEGVWNDGLFKGYPYITEMYNSHWVDGTFDGGHFYAEKPSFTFQDTYYSNGFVGLTFGLTAHGFLPGDLITIDKDDKSINPQYDGDHEVTSIVDEYLLVTNIPWGDNTSNERGTVTRRTSTGLIQNFNFYDNNISQLTSRDTKNLEDLWRYESWIDVNYSNESTTNINSTRIYTNKSTTNFRAWIDQHKFGIGDYAVLNLYGFITEDVLSSISYFRGLDSIQRRAYNLGTKYEIYQDFLGDISNFNNPFDTDPELGTLDNFVGDGWTWSFSGISGGTYSYINNYIKKGSNQQTITSQSSVTSGIPVWNPLIFQTNVENSFGLLLTASTSNTEWTVNTSGLFEVNVNLQCNFQTSVQTSGIQGGIDNDYLYTTGGVTVGQIRLLKYSNGSWIILQSRTIKTTGGDFNIGTVKLDEGQDTGIDTKNLEIFIDWKGQLENGDKLKVEFQSCQTTITNYNSAGPWRGSGFEQGFGLNDNITSVLAIWDIDSSRTITISNSGTNNSLGFNMRRTTDGTLLVEHLENSFHSLTLNNSNINIPRNRYSMIEFDLLQSPDTSYRPSGFSYSFHWTDLYNFTTFINSDLSYSSIPAFPSQNILSQVSLGTASGVASPVIVNPQSKTPLWSGIDYTKTSSTKKREFFFNRPGLDLGLFAEQRTEFRQQTHELDNIKFYEVDMIPFFQYTIEDFVDKSIKIPYQGNAPFIDYENSEFSFVENISIGLDSIDLVSTTGTYQTPPSNPFIFTNPPPSSATPTGPVAPVIIVR